MGCFFSGAGCFSVVLFCTRVVFGLFLVVLFLQLGCFWVVFSCFCAEVRISGTAAACVSNPIYSPQSGRQLLRSCGQQPAEVNEASLRRPKAAACATQRAATLSRQIFAVNMPSLSLTQQFAPVPPPRGGRAGCRWQPDTFAAKLQSTRSAGLCRRRLRPARLL